MFLKLIRTGSLSLALLAGTPAGAQSLTLTVTEVRSTAGRVVAALCGDSTVPFPGLCMTASAMTDAQLGETTLVFNDVPDGTYALQVFHDENSDMIPQIPPEGFAFGNNAPFPPSFADAALRISGETRGDVKMTYLAAPAVISHAASAPKAVPAPAGVRRTLLRDEGLVGDFYMPAGGGARPALLVLGGSEGGSAASSQIGAQFAQEGYAVLALAYFLDDGLPQSLETIPLEYFDRAIAWLRRQAGVNPDRVGVIGGSRGSEAALLLASRNPDVKAVMVFSPSGVVWQGLDFENPLDPGPAWTLGGDSLPFRTPDVSKYRAGGAMRPMFEAALGGIDLPDTEIPVERIRGPILLISGQDDALWPSSSMAEKIMTRLRAKDFGYHARHLTYEGAGHAVFIGNPAGPGIEAGAEATANPVFGGTVSGNLAAWRQNWPESLAFFYASLKE